MPCVTTKISTPSSAGTACSFLFLANRALRIELADAAALGAGRRVDHRVDEGRLAGVHGRVDRALEFVRRCRLNADAAESFRDLVVARALDEDGRGGVRTARRLGGGGAVNGRAG